MNHREWEDEFEWEVPGVPRSVASAAHPGLAAAVTRAIIQPSSQIILPSQRAAEFEDEMELELEGEYECEYEYEYEDELFLNPANRAFRLPLMGHLGSAAATARTEAEAEAFLGALVPLAAQLAPRVGGAIMRAAPQLIQGVANAGRAILRSPVARPLVRAVPAIVQGTVADLAGQVAAGRPITAQGAVRTLARRTQRTLSNPAGVQRAINQTRRQDRQYHRQVPSGRPCR
jgi:hypothetical protein